MKIKIANIVKDDKFIDLLFDSLALLNDKWENDFLLVRNRKPDSYKYIKNSDRVTFVQTDAFLEYLVNQEYHAVFLHSLTCLPLSIIPKINQRIKVFWFSWGKDIYQMPKNKPLIQLNLIKKETQKEIDKLNNTIVTQKRKSLKDYLRPIKYIFYDSPTNKRIKHYYKALKRVDYFSGVLEYEYNFMKSVKGFKAKRVTFKYASIQALENTGITQLFKGRNILIGNSAASTNNHLDGEKIIDLKDFLPAQEYSDLLLSCSVAIFFMERQQAMGNINGTLLRGCKVFLSETNPVYRFYKDLGLKIFSVQRDLTQSEIDSPLSNEDIENNRAILSNRTNKEQYIKDLNHIYECIINDKD